MKTERNFKVRKLSRQDLKNLKGGDLHWGKERVCCTDSGDGTCCEWAKDLWSCQYIYC